MEYAYVVPETSKESKRTFPLEVVRFWPRKKAHLGKAKCPLNHFKHLRRSVEIILIFYTLEYLKCQVIVSWVNI